MKYFIIIIFFLFISCNNNQWSDLDQKMFVQDCTDAGETLNKCTCLLSCIMQDFKNYEHASINFIQNHSSEQLSVCTSKCN